MKKIILIALIAFMGSCTVTKYTSIPLEKYEITTNLSKEENYDMINTWFVKMAISRPEYIIQYTNKDSGIISGEFTTILEYINHNQKSSNGVTKSESFTKKYDNVKIFLLVKNENNKVTMKFEVSEIIDNQSLLSSYNNYINWIIEDITEYSTKY